MERLLAAGGVLGASAVSSCCALPLALAAVGIGGAWLGSPAILVPYQPLLIAIAALCIGLGLWRTYRPAKPAREASNCSPPAARRLTRTALWLALVILLVGASAEWWGRLLA